jgi:uncharacterized RDD family membrane protein YckC
MARWRDIKKGKKTLPKNKKQEEKKDIIISVSPLHRIKAFITDMFMIMMPIMYITTYIVLDGKDSFQSNNLAHWITMAIYGLVTVIFWVKKGQTPGFKAYSIKLIDDNTKQTLTFGLAVARYFMFIISATTILGALLPFFREDKKTFQDLIMQTSVISVEHEADKLN